MDRVWLAPAWRGPGAGRLLTARLLGWVCPDPTSRLAAIPAAIAAISTNGLTSSRTDSRRRVAVLGQHHAAGTGPIALCGATRAVR